MERFLNIVKDHPLWILGGVLVGVLLISWAWSGNSAPAEGSGQSVLTVDPNVIAANTQLVLSQDALSAQGQMIAASLKAQQDDNATALAMAQMGQHQNEQANEFQYMLANKGLDVNKDLSTIELANMREATLLQSGQNMAMIEAGYNIGMIEAQNPTATRKGIWGSYTGPVTGMLRHGSINTTPPPPLTGGSLSALIQRLLNPQGTPAVPAA